MLGSAGSSSDSVPKYQDVLGDGGVDCAFNHLLSIANFSNLYAPLTDLPRWLHHCLKALIDTPPVSYLGTLPLDRYMIPPVQKTFL